MRFIADARRRAKCIRRRSPFTHRAIVDCGAFRSMSAQSRPVTACRIRPSPTEAVAIPHARVAEFAYRTLTDDLCLLAARIN
jgi:hypothetical protein